MDEAEIRPTGESGLIGVGEFEIDVNVRDHLEMIGNWGRNCTSSSTVAKL